MNKETSDPKSPDDHGEVVLQAHRKISWAWVFPILAATLTIWMFWSNWASRGPEIEVVFETAPGVEIDKTPLIFRGMKAGEVTGMRLGDGMKTVILTVRLESFAADLAREGTDFWIERPVVGLGELSGLTSLIQGNSLQARQGSGPPTRKFVGRDLTPLTPLESPALVLHLHADQLPALERGAPLFYRGIPVGEVEKLHFDLAGNPILRVVVDKDYADRVRTSSRFWPVPATSLKLGRGGVTLNLLSLKAIVLGGLNFDDFGEPGEPVFDEAEFVLYADEMAARATGHPVRISFHDGRGLLAGETEIRHLGMPVGLVEKVTLGEEGQVVEVEARFRPEFNDLPTAGTTFSLIRPRISLEGISGLDTLVTGVYVDCQPGPAGEPVNQFVGLSYNEDDERVAGAKVVGIPISLHAENISQIRKGAQIFYRGLVAGRVVGASVGADKEPILQALVHPEFAGVLTQNARFWTVPPAKVEAGPGRLNLELNTLESLVDGAVAFDVFGVPGAVAGPGSGFEIFPTEAMARASSEPVRITFEHGQGLVAGQTQVRYLGLPVGMVETVRPWNGKVEAIIRMNQDYEDLLRKGSVFTVVRLKVSLDEGVTGLETALSGVYIECVPSEGGAPARKFTGVTMTEALFRDREKRGFEIMVTTPQTEITEGAPVSYRGLTVGRIGRKVLASDGRLVGLTAIIERPYASLIRENTKFWDAGGVRISMGFLAFHVKSPWLESLAARGIAFATPDEMGPRVKPGYQFELHAQPRPNWLRWAPELPGAQ